MKTKERKDRRNDDRRQVVADTYTGPERRKSERRDTGEITPNTN